MSKTIEASSARRRGTPLACLLLMGGVLFSSAGCSLFVMAGTMLVGRPMNPAVFDEFTDKSLADKGIKTVVICKAPMGADDQTAALGQELQAEISRRLRQHEIDVVRSHKVARWIDDNGGEWGSPEELFDKFPEADFLVFVNVEDFSYLEKNSPGLYRGRSHLEVSVFENNQYNAKIYAIPIESVYPQRYEKMADQVSRSAFRKQFLDHLSTRIAQLFYKHRPEETFD